MPTPEEIQNAPKNLSITQTKEFGKLPEPKQEIIRMIIQSGQMSLDQVAQLMAPEPFQKAEVVQQRIGGFLGDALYRNNVDLDKLAETLRDALHAKKKFAMNGRDGNGCEIVDLGPDHKLRMLAVNLICKLTPGMIAPTKLDINKKTTHTVGYSPEVVATIRAHHEAIRERDANAIPAEFTVEPDENRQAG